MVIGILDPGEKGTQTGGQTENLPAQFSERYPLQIAKFIFVPKCLKDFAENCQFLSLFHDMSQTGARISEKSP